jgi:hypothetical protein
MKKTIIGVAAALFISGAVVYAQAPGYWGGGGPGPGWGPGMGPGMMRSYGPYARPDYGHGEAISLDQAKEIAKEYTDKYLKGFTVERVLPFTGMRHTMYGVELKGPKDEVRFLHINP